MIYRDLYDLEYEFYDEFYSDYTEDIEMFRRILEKYCEKGGRILDLMCGTGRIMSHFLDYYEVWGVDINEKMLDIALRKFESNENVKIVKMDALKLHLDVKFNAVIIGLNSLMLFPREDRKVLFQKIGEHLEKGGVFIADFWNYIDLEENVVYHGDTKEIGGRIVSRFFTISREGERIKTLYFYDIVSDESVRRKCAEIILYTIPLNTLREDLKYGGMEIVEIYGDYDFSEYNESSPRVIFVAVKR